MQWSTATVTNKTTRQWGLAEAKKGQGAAQYRRHARTFWRALPWEDRAILSLMAAARAFKDLLAKLSDSIRVTDHTLYEIKFRRPDLRTLYPIALLFRCVAREDRWIGEKRCLLR